MSNNKVYELRIVNYKDNTTLYTIHSYQLVKDQCGHNRVSNLYMILSTKDKYEIKIKLNLLGLSFISLKSEIINNNKNYINSIKSVAYFKLNSSYENERQ